MSTPNVSAAQESVPDAAAAADASVLNGTKRPDRKPTPRKAKSKPATTVSLAVVPDSPAPGPAPEPKPVPVRRTSKQDLARRYVEAVASIFKEEPNGQDFLKGMTWDEARQQVANWCDPLPTGGEGPGPLRWWPEDLLPRPDTTGWRRPV